jgi:hypothetical protein
MEEYETDITAATIESHQILLKLGIWERMTCIRPNVIT